MRRFIVVALLIVGCGKADPQVAKVDPAYPTQATQARVPKSARAKRGPETFRDFPTRPEPKALPKEALRKEEASVSIAGFLGKTYQNIQITNLSEPKEYNPVFETNRPGWIVSCSFTADNATLKCHEKATDHMFILSRPDGGGVQTYWHGSDEPQIKARVGDEWFKLNRPPQPATVTTP